MRVCADRAAQLRITGITEAGAVLAAQAHDVDGERRIEQREDSEISCRDRWPLHVRRLSVLFEHDLSRKTGTCFSGSCANLILLGQTQ
jgi:hypothetical protein